MFAVDYHSKYLSCVLNDSNYCLFVSAIGQNNWEYTFFPVGHYSERFILCNYADPLVALPFWSYPPWPVLQTCSTTVLKELQDGHWIPKKCQLRRWLLVSQSLHIMSTIRCRSPGMGCSAMSRARASHAAAIDCCETTVFLHIGQR